MSYTTLCGLFGKSRQSYYKHIHYLKDTSLKDEIILTVVRQTRKKAQTRNWGVRKLKDLVNKELAPQGIQVGRDHLFALLRQNNMLVRKRKRKFFTTQSHHWLHKYDNLIEDKKLTGPNQLWVSDITYIKSQTGVCYLYLITDAYSQKIVGWHISEDLKAKSAVMALRSALKANKGRLDNLIHHSDRGVQYCSGEYVKLLERNGVRISMTNPGSPQENAIAERLNGILKEEWLYDANLENVKAGKKKLKQIVSLYNSFRPHNSLANKTPDDIHDLGFSRHEAVRVIGQSYTYKKRAASSDRPFESNNAHGQTTIPRAVAPQQSCLPLGRCSTKEVKIEASTIKSY